VGCAHQNRFEKWWAKPTLQAAQTPQKEKPLLLAIDFIKELG